MIRFLADADLNEGIIGGCLRREPTMDFLSSSEAKLQGPEWSFNHQRSKPDG